MKELTREQFAKELAELGEKCFNVQSEDCGAVNLVLCGCKVGISLEDGVEGEINIFKPHTEMDVTIDFCIVDTIKKDNSDSYHLEFIDTMPDIVISYVA